MNRKRTLLFGAVVSLALFAAMALAVRDTAAWQTEGGDSAAANSLDAIVQVLFTDQVIAFEVLGILLTAAMIGALVIARPLTGTTDESHYGHPSQTEFEETAHVADPARHVEAPK